MENGRLQNAKTQTDLAGLLNIQAQQLTYWAYVARTETKFRSFNIPKKSGGERTITAPTQFLASLLQTLKELLEEIYKPNYAVHGYVKERSIVTNALRHINRAYVLNFDLENFFPSITFPRIRGLLLAKPYGLTNAIATTVAQLCCCNGLLPQGAPTSPIIANMICGRLDGDLKKFFKSYRCTYTRYADDITVSTHQINFPEEIAVLVDPPYGTKSILSSRLVKIVNDNGFTINESKTRLQDYSHRQMVTGLVVNKFPNVRRHFIREIRLLVHIWEQYGLAEAAKSYSKSYSIKPRISKTYLKKILIGRLNYLSMVRGVNNPIYVSLAKRIRTLDSRLMKKPLDMADAIEAAVWIIETNLDEVKDAERISQGTGVMLDGIGLVTCDHVISEPLVAYRPNNPAKRYAVKILKRHGHVDLAVLKIKKKSTTSLKIGNIHKVEIHSPVTIVGFPDHAPGSGIYRDDGYVTQIKMLHGVRHFLVTMPIIKGASGSPILDKSGKVVGIAARGDDSLQKSKDSSSGKYAAIFIDELSKLMPLNTKERKKKKRKKKNK